MMSEVTDQISLLKINCVNSAPDGELLSSPREEFSGQTLLRLRWKISRVAPLELFVEQFGKL